MFENKQGILVGSCEEDDKIFPCDLLQSELFYPTHKDIVDTNSFFIELTCKAASIFRVEFRDKRNATTKYLSSIVGIRAWRK